MTFARSVKYLLAAHQLLGLEKRLEAAAHGCASGTQALRRFVAR
jgi:hypothetical protein